MPFETLQAFLAWSPPPTKQFVGGDILLEQTKLCIFSGPKMFKSILAQQLGFCIATGQDWLGFPTVQGKVALLQSEIAKKSFQTRIRSMAFNYRTPLGMFVVDTNPRFKLDKASDITLLKRALERAKPDILILDPWYKMLTNEDNQAYSRTQDVLDDMIADFKLAVVMIHHDTKPIVDSKTGNTISSSVPRGPRTVEGWFDSLIHIDGDRNTDDRILKFELRHGSVLQPPLNIQLNRQRLLLGVK